MIQFIWCKGWVFFKGGWELDEECIEVVVCEVWEEVGILVMIDYDLGDIEEISFCKKNSLFGKFKQKEVVFY